MNITVYLGSREGNDPLYTEMAEDIGTWIGRNGHTLVYGGSKTGLMGTLARAALSAGGRVVGVEPQAFIDDGFNLPGLTDLVVTPDMSTRRTVMMKYGDIFVAFPGGVGTLEELSEILCQIHLGNIQAPCLILNVNGFYDALRDLLLHMQETGFYPESSFRLISFINSKEEFYEALTARAAAVDSAG